MRNVGYEALSNELVANDKLELQASGENLDAVLRSLPLQQVKTILDVGCGSGSLSRALAKHLGEEVQVYGLDISKDHIRYAEETAAKQGLNNVHYLQGDLFDLGAEWAGAFDLVYEKYVLMSFAPRNLGQAFLSSMRDCARAGGKVICIEADINFGQERYPPPPEALAKVLPSIVNYYRGEGLIEWRCGVRLYHYFKLAGFIGPEVKLIDGRTITGGFPRELVEHDNIDVEQLIEPCLKLLNMSESIDEVACQWRDYLASPDNFIYTPIFMCTGTVH